MIIAVDGPAASGKGTIARALAAHFELPHLDTGLLYRAVGLVVARGGGDPDDAAAALAACDFPIGLLDDPELRSEEAGAYASRVSIHPQVRAALVDYQRTFADQPGGAVLDGRDIGTVIAPDADAKLFVTASAETRARPPPCRRVEQQPRRRLCRDPRRYRASRQTRQRARHRAAASGGRCGLARYDRSHYIGRRPAGHRACRDEDGRAVTPQSQRAACQASAIPPGLLARLCAFNPKTSGTNRTA